MRAVVVERYGAPEVLEPARRADAVADAGQVLVRLRAAGVNPVDAICRRGEASWMPVPFTPGFDGAGIVEKADPATGFTPGQPVYVALAGGTYAELIACDATAVHPLPEGVSFAAGAALGIPYATAYGAVFLKAGAVPGETLLVRGASGGVGQAAVQFAVAAGLRVIGTAGSDEGLALLRSLGAVAVDHRRPDLPDALREALGGEGADVILETKSANVASDIALAAPSGRIAIVGDRDPITFDAAALTARRVSLIGVNVGGFSPAENRHIHAAIAAGIKAGTLKPRIAATFPLAEAAAAHRLLGQPGLNGKIVLTIPE
jgi:NADPH:quinone reductase